ncbi:hypothetical protein C1H46_031801 [Malus baccata]|uniref:Small ribosomal subunit protein eS4 N-terminal domain-containing protein n=1 Tax=Malus baccata TaxID=106549 RepID=A0A540L7X9_MALBA|nr:hypothetical protein C1H46_031801 [Malus baccata]
MARGLKKHLKRLNAPKHWMLDKLGCAFAPKQSSWPPQSQEVPSPSSYSEEQVEVCTHIP